MREVDALTYPRVSAVLASSRQRCARRRISAASAGEVDRICSRSWELEGDGELPALHMQESGVVEGVRVGRIAPIDAANAL